MPLGGARGAGGQEQQQEEREEGRVAERVGGPQAGGVGGRKMVPVQISESVVVVQVPNYQETSVGSCVDFVSMQRHRQQVQFEPTLAPVHFADTLICYKDSTRKRFISRTYYEPRVRPRRFGDTTFVYPKRPDASFVSYLDYHIDECRRWFKTCLEFKAKTFTSTCMEHLGQTGEVLGRTRSWEQQQRTTSGGRRGDAMCEGDRDPGACQVYIPKFKCGDPANGLPEIMKRFQFKDGGGSGGGAMDINMNGPVNGF